MYIETNELISWQLTARVLITRKTLYFIIE